MSLPCTLLCPFLLNKVHHYSSINFLIPLDSFMCMQCRSHFNLSFGIVFLTINYLHRFVSICQCNVRIVGYLSVCNICWLRTFLTYMRSDNEHYFYQDWEYWMLELLSIACLSIAIKFNEISGLSLHEIQVTNCHYIHHFMSYDILIVWVGLYRSTYRIRK